MFILRRIIKSCNEFPEKPAPCRERNVWTDSPETPQTRLAERGQPMSRWYPCRISCKPSQGPPMRGTCPPQRPGEGIEFESGWAEPHPGALADGFPAGRGKRFGKEALSIGARNETCRSYYFFSATPCLLSRTRFKRTELKSSDSSTKKGCLQSETAFLY